MRPSLRLFGIVLVGLLVLGMGVHYDANYETNWPYPTGDALETDYESHVGDRTFLFGTVRAVDRENATVEILVETEQGELPLTVGGVERSVQPGGAVQVYGTVEPDRHLAADRVVVVNPAGSSLLFKYGVSLVGALLVVVLFFRHWRFDTDGVGFEVR
ncbi:hypothetical protein [Halorientalis regularis]|jgi:preprotein translocase subunit SecF|uniref:Uncharacterized protein n=1 Tax=Halorientalis regularis TaxID=660518 RepID=A0A1G7KZ79_9EURY|nr:hypothetical protein [Halorientalis regularis]SDF42567.1 hypothetical protein SAMN05216218_10697 [Halorientalis regularis]